MANTPETSSHASIKRRITSAKGEATQPAALYPFVGNPRESMPDGLPFCLEDYLQLVDWTGRSIPEDKRGAINDRLPCILTRLNFDAVTWRKFTTQFWSEVSLLAGSQKAIERHAFSFGYQRKSPRTATNIFLS